MSVLCRCLGWFLCGVGWPVLTAAEPVYSASLTIRSLHTDNVFTQDDAPLAAGQTVAAVPANAPAFVANLGAALGVTWIKSPGLQLAASYAPDVFRYSRYPGENHTDHRFTASAAGATGSWQYDIKTVWLKTAGPEDSPVFNRLGGPPPTGLEPVRARRSQDLVKSNARLTWVNARSFVRGVAAINHHDFHTRQSPLFGYANYVDRSEWSAGPEAGLRLTRGLSAVAGVRLGRQQQADLLGVAHNYTNTFTRYLVGLEGTASPELTFSGLVGPDRRQYGPAVRAGFDRSPAPTYFEGNATWTPHAADKLTLSARRYLWLNSGGRGAYIDSQWDLNWRHQWNARWSVTTALNEHTFYAGRYNPVTPRRDFVHTISCTVTRTLDAHTRLDLGLGYDWSEALAPNTPSHEYRRFVWSAGFTRAW